MAVKDILAKVVAGTELTEDEKTALAEYQEPDTSKIESELKDKIQKAAFAKATEDKKKYLSEIDELKSKVESLESSGLSEAEKLQRELERAIKAREKAEADYSELQKAHTHEQRSSQLKDIAGKIQFMDNVPSDMAYREVSAVFGDIENLSDEGQVKARMEQFRESHAGLIKSESNMMGTGKHSQAGGAPSGGKLEVGKMSEAEYEANREQILADYAAGKIV